MSAPLKTEKDWTQSGKSGWKHPYVLYILLTLLLFAILVIGAALALKQGWIPQRV
jgi:hypothetical protein